MKDIVNEAVTREEWMLLSPWEMGYVSYFQGEWNPAIPKDVPFAATSEEYREFLKGQQKAVIDCQDMEE